MPQPFRGSLHDKFIALTNSSLYSLGLNFRIMRDQCLFVRSLLPCLILPIVSVRAEASLGPDPLHFLAFLECPVFFHCEDILFFAYFNFLLFLDFKGSAKRIAPAFSGGMVAYGMVIFQTPKNISEADRSPSGI